MMQAPPSTNEVSTEAGLLMELDRVTALCLAEPHDPSIDYELDQLHLLRAALQDPRPEHVLANEIVIGAFAAKNIADWNPALADALMDLDYKLRQRLPQIPRRHNQAAA